MYTKVLCSAGDIACQGRQEFDCGSDSGIMIPVHSKIGQEMRIHFERLVSWYRRKQLIPVYSEDNIFNFYLSNEVKSTETNIVNNSQQPGMAEQCARKSNENSEHRSGSNW